MSVFRVAQKYVLRYKKRLLIPKTASRLIIIRKLTNWQRSAKQVLNKHVTNKPGINANYCKHKMYQTQWRRNTTNPFKKKPTINPSYSSLYTAGIVGVILCTTIMSLNIKHNLDQHANHHPNKYAVKAAGLWGNDNASKSRPTAVITGASSGIGASITAKLLSENWNVVLIARSVEKMEEITKKYKRNQYLIIKCDVSKAEECIAACVKISKWSNGKVHLLLNNAACFNIASMEDETLEDHQRILRTNVTAPYIFTKHLIPSLKQGAESPFNDQYQATVVNVSSVNAPTAYYYVTSYGVSKAALESLTKHNALELTKYNIRVNAVRFGTIKTAMQHPEVTKIAPKINPIGRNGYTSDTDELIMFLADKNKSGFMTGSIVTCDGGFLLVDSFGNPNNTQQGEGLDTEEF